MFTKQDFDYIFSVKGEEIYRTQKLSLVFTPSTKGLMFIKHGPPKSVSQWCKEQEEQNVKDLIQVETSDLSPEKLNAVLYQDKKFPQHILNQALKGMN